MCNSQQTKTCHFQSVLFLTNYQNVVCFSLPFIFPSKAALECKYWPLLLLFDYILVKFWWSWARMKLLIFYPKRELPSLMCSVVVLYSFFPAVASTRYTRCSALGDAIFHTHIWVVKFLQFLRRKKILFCPKEAVNFSIFAAMINASFDLVAYIIRKENSSSSACGFVDTHPFTGSYSSLPKVSCFLT